MLNKSYRSTYEIITFAKRIKNIAALEPVEWHGDEPVWIKKAVCDFEASKNASFGIILKTYDAAKTLYDILSKEFEVSLIALESMNFKNGVSITSVLMSKGLEFDWVIVPDVNSDIYKTEYDRNLLYIACKRAMHRLTLTHTGQLCCLITQ